MHQTSQAFQRESVGVLTPWSAADVSPLLLAFGRAFRSRTISHSLTSFTIRCLLYTFSAVCSVHKQATCLYSDERGRSCKLLNIKRYLVAGGGIEPPTLGL